MRTAVHNFTRQYAVISVSTEPRRTERSVLAYSDEKTLRELLAEPSIVSLGYRSREEAIANLNECAPTRPASAANLTPASVEMAERSLDQSGTTARLFQCGLDFAKHRNFIYSLLGHSFAAATAFFYSKNLLSTVIRAVISF